MMTATSWLPHPRGAHGHQEPHTGWHTHNRNTHARRAGATRKRAARTQRAHNYTAASRAKAPRPISHNATRAAMTSARMELPARVSKLREAHS